MFTKAANRGRIYLTFDDGPEDKYTEKILEILKKYNVKATFFLLGENVARFPAIAKRIASEGHTLGNHAYHHRDLTLLTEKEIVDELENTKEIIFRVTEKKVRLFRPPWGKRNEKLLNLIKKLGYNLVLWTIDPRDFDEKKTIFSMRYEILSQLNDGAVVLLHCINQRTIKILPSIIDEIRKQGYKIARLA